MNERLGIADAGADGASRREGRRVEVDAGAGRQQVRCPLSADGDDGRRGGDIHQRAGTAAERRGEAGCEPAVVGERRDEPPFIGAEADEQRAGPDPGRLARLQRQGGSQGRLDGLPERGVAGRATQHEALARRALGQQHAARPAGARAEVEPGKGAAPDIGGLVSH